MSLKTEIKARIILEILGRPPEHLVESLEEIIKKIDEEKGVSVLSKKINTPVEIKEKKGFYSTFAEIEVEVEDILLIGTLLFNYMPAHIEIVSPEKINLENNDMNEVFNEIARRLHGYDEVARVLEFEKKILEKKLRDLIESQKENSNEKNKKK